MSQRCPFVPDHSHLREARYRKAEAMRTEALNPYPAFFDATHLAE